jgi:hypothetical protein
LHNQQGQARVPNRANQQGQAGTKRRCASGVAQAALQAALQERRCKNESRRHIVCASGQFITQFMASSLQMKGFAASEL